MPPMEWESYDALLTELNNPETTHDRRTEILQELRTDYNTVHQDTQDYESRISKFEKENNELLKSNSMLFRQAGIMTEDQQEDEEQKNLSETITLEQIESSLR